MRVAVGAPRFRGKWRVISLMLAVAALPVLAQAQAANVKPDTAGNSASSFSYRRADLGSGYSTSSVLKLPDRSPHFITCNCDDHTLQDMTCPTQAYACTCVPHAYLTCQ